MNSRRTTLIIAIVVAAAVGYLTVHYLTSVAPPVQPVVESKEVVVASRDIHAHEKLVPEMLTSVRRPVDQIEPGAIGDDKAAEGDVSLIAIPEGAQITDAKIGRPAQIGLPGKLPIGMRAVSIPMDYIKSVSGLVEPGDKVDVMESYTRGSANRPPPTRTIIRSALVLAVNSTLEPTDSASAAPGAGPSAPTAVTLEVTPAQADLLTFADFNTSLRLAVRPEAEPPRSESVEEIALPDLAAAPAPAPPAPAPAPPVAVPAPPVAVAPPVSKPSVIEVVTGDHIDQGGSH